jgi:hypothetical protein
MLPVVVLLLGLFAREVSAQGEIRNVILVTLDGVRTQEMFGGMDAEIFRSTNKNYDRTETFKKFDAPTPRERREKLMPFFWKTLMVSHGSIAGNRELKSEAKTTNKLFFSYPGYSELLTGQAHDDVIKSNNHPQNPYPSFLDFLHGKWKLGFNDVAEISSWDAFERIATNKPGTFLVNAGFKEYSNGDAGIAGLSRAQFETVPAWNGARYDYYTFRFALSHMKKHRPRVVHVGFDDTDDWAHQKNYERVVQTLNRNDEYLKELWNFVQTDAKYRGKTAIIITTDHGRGKTAEDWDDHGEDVPEAQYIWMAFISPGVSLRGEWRDAETIYQNQVAATLCKFVGVDYSEQNRDAGKPIERLFAYRK